MEEPLLSPSPGDSPAPSLSKPSTLRVCVIVTVLVLLYTADTVLVTILFDQWAEKYALFINQGTAFVYIIWALAVLAIRACIRRNSAKSSDGPSPHRLTAVTLFQDDPSAEIDPFGDSHHLKGSGTGTQEVDEPKPTPAWYILVAIGCFNGLANFFMAIAQPHTPGLTQSILNLLGIPLVLLFVWMFLRRAPSGLAAAGAALIIVGTATSALRAVPGVIHEKDDSAPIKAEWWAVISYAIAQLFLSGEKVFEEHTFTKFRSLDPLVMFAWTLTTQFILGWALLPVQTVPALGDIHLKDIPNVIADGTRCTLGANVGDCGTDPAYAVLFWVYCAVDFNCYLFGLWVIQQYGASLMVLASAISLPLQQLVLCARPFVGKWVETFFWGDAVALGTVCIGLWVYLGCSPEGKKERGVK